MCDLLCRKGGPEAQKRPEAQALAHERTEAMILGLDRELRIAYLLGDVFNLSGEEAAEVLEIDPAAFRKRLSRARTRLHEFLRGLPSGVQFSFFASAFVFGSPDLPLSGIPFADFVARAERMIT